MIVVRMDFPHVLSSWMILNTCDESLLPCAVSTNFLLHLLENRSILYYRAGSKKCYLVQLTTNGTWEGRYIYYLVDTRCNLGL